jgi:D-3-phosphoglycerate dehydrogenase
MIKIDKHGGETHKNDLTFAILAGIEKYDAEVLAQYPNLKVISRRGSGIDNIDEDYCKEHGIAIENTPYAPVQAVAEYVVFQILNHIRKFNESTWDNKKIGKELKSLTVGIIGNGNIGSKVHYLLLPFGCEINVYDIIPDLSNSTKEWLLHTSDIITIHIPMCKGNYHFIGKRLLSLMKKDACLINTSRGDIIDEEALFDILVDNPAMTAILDVFSQEPYEGKLKTLKNTVLTPHIASYTDVARKNMEIQAIANCMKYIAKT